MRVKLTDKVMQLNARLRDMPLTCRHVRCRRSGECLGQPQACRAALDAAVALERAESSPDDPQWGLRLFREALLSTLAKRQAEAAAPAGWRGCAPIDRRLQRGSTLADDEGSETA